MKLKLKESKEFQPVTLEITFVTLEEIEKFVDAATSLKDSTTLKTIGEYVYDYIIKNYNDQNER